jgi:hypothetical protein
MKIPRRFLHTISLRRVCEFGYLKQSFLNALPFENRLSFSFGHLVFPPHQIVPPGPAAAGPKSASEVGKIDNGTTAR